MGVYVVEYLVPIILNNEQSLFNMTYQWIFESKVFDNLYTYTPIHLNTEEQFYAIALKNSPYDYGLE